MIVTLSPSQESRVTELVASLPKGDVLVLWGPAGSGKSTMLAEVQRRTGGKILTLADFLAAHRRAHPLAMEETFAQIVLDALSGDGPVLCDDVHLIDAIVGSCAGFRYPRCGMFDVVGDVLRRAAQGGGKRLVLVHQARVPRPLHVHADYFGFKRFEAADYAHLCGSFLGPESARGLDFERLHRFAPRLSGYQLREVCTTLRDSGKPIDTDRFTQVLLDQGLISNVSLAEVEPIALADLRGIEGLIRSLEAHVVVPFEDTDLAKKLGMQPKRGVLLYGPPGTGKTSIGRALAHRLRGKFFLIDGSFIAGADDFYERIARVFRQARENAPSVIFIDDSDVLFETEEGSSIYRLLLSELDGVMNQSPELVCVMMTAMDVGTLPPALIRSGRLELWLELQLPGETARREILSAWIARLPADLRDVDLEAATRETEGLTGADLRRVVADVRNLHGHGTAKGEPPRSGLDYLREATAAVRDNQKRRAEAETKSRSQSAARRGRNPFLPTGLDPGS